MSRFDSFTASEGISEVNLLRGRKMAMTGLKAFDTTIEKTNIWLKEIMQEMNTEDRHRAYNALSSVLHALRDRMPVDEVVQLGAQLPMLVRGFYYEGWDPGCQSSL